MVWVINDFEIIVTITENIFLFYFLFYTHKQNYKIYRILVMQDWTSLTKTLYLGQSFAIKNILSVNAVEIEVSNDTA